MSEETNTATAELPVAPAVGSASGEQTGASHGEQSGALGAEKTGALGGEQTGALRATEHGDGASIQDKIVEALTTVFDPEIPVNIYELGLIYDVDVAQDGEVTITMTLTTPHCPVAGSLPGEVQEKVAAIDGVKQANVNLVWEPPWTPERMSEAAKLELGWL